MTKEECVALIKKRMSEYETDRAEKRGYTGNCDSWFDGIQRGLQDALEIMGMLDKDNKLHKNENRKT